MPAYVFIPADLEPAKIDHALAYGATVVPIDGTYDDVNRLCLEVADETGWGFVNVNLRPFYAEGSKTLAFEVAEGLGWRSPDVIVAPDRLGGHVHQAREGLRRAGRRGPIERRPIRFVGGQAAGCAPVATAWEPGDDVEPVAHPGHVRPLAGDRQPGRRPLLRRARARLAAGPSRRSRTRRPLRRSGRWPRSRDLRRDGRRRDVGRCRGRPPRGVIREGDEVVVLLTGQRAEDAGCAAARP